VQLMRNGIGFAGWGALADVRKLKPSVQLRM
jgi:hypothetical protein